SVVITGTNFTGTTAVSFAGTAAVSFVVNSATKITAVAPAHAAGAVDITVTTAAGTSATSAADQFAFVVSLASRIVYLTQPVNTTAGTILNSITVQAVDQYGNLASGRWITMSLLPGTLLAGTKTVITNILGRAVFGSLLERIAGTYNLKAAAALMSASS